MKVELSPASGYRMSRAYIHQARPEVKVPIMNTAASAPGSNRAPGQFEKRTGQQHQKRH
ncbi:MAG: hypothetical protein ABJA49_17350 [Betaproteobacteria bacterium]